MRYSLACVRVLLRFILLLLCFLLDCSPLSLLVLFLFLLRLYLRSVLISFVLFDFFFLYLDHLFAPIIRVRVPPPSFPLIIILIGFALFCIY